MCVFGSYAQGPFSGMELVRRYMDTAGDQECLSWDTGDGVTILQVRKRAILGPISRSMII